MKQVIRLPDDIAINRCPVFQPLKGSTVSDRDILIETKLGNGALTVYLTAEKTPVSEVKLRWRGVIPPGGTFLADHWERGYGDLQFRVKVDGRPLPWYFLHQREGGCTLYGVKVRPSAICWWEVQGCDLLLHLDTRSGAYGVELKGRRLKLAEVVWAQSGERPFAALRDFLHTLCTDSIYDGAPIYGANNWYYAYGKSSREAILGDALYLAKMTEGLANRPFMVIDDGWQAAHSEGYNGGPWRKANADYGDMGEIAAEMKGMGVRPGIWTRPLLDTSDSIPEGWRFQRDSSVLDISVPAVLEHIAEDVRTIAGWGYELLKYDFSTYDIFGRWGPKMGRRLTEPGWRFRDRSKTTAELIGTLYRTIYENAGDMLILGCNCIGHLGAGLMHANRTGDDTSGVEWARTKKMGVNALAFRMPQHGAFYAADADCVGITDKIDWAKNCQWMELLSESGTPFFVSVKPGTLRPEQEKELRLAYEKASGNTTIAEPFDWIEAKTPRRWNTAFGERKYNW